MAAPLGGRSWTIAAVIVGGVVACCRWPISPAYALIGGALFALIVGNPFSRITDSAAQWMLKAAVVGIGAGMNLGLVWRIGVESFGYTVVTIGLTMGAGWWAARRLGLERALSVLICAGTAICGGSAIAAVAGVIRPKASETTLALVIVFLLNGVALFAFPPLGAWLRLDPQEFGLWAALAIHDTSSVVGAAIAYGSEAVEVATTTKLVRALWIVPLVVGLGWAWRRGGETTRARSRLPVPGFILGFVAAAALFTYWAPLAEWRLDVAGGARRLFTGTLFLIGLGFSRDALRQLGPRPLLFAVSLWLAVTTGTVLAIVAGWIG